MVDFEIQIHKLFFTSNIVDTRYNGKRSKADPKFETQEPKKQRRVPIVTIFVIRKLKRSNKSVLSSIPTRDLMIVESIFLT